MIAAFPLVWIAVMSFRLPVDALSANPITVLLAPATLRLVGGVSVPDLLFGFAGIWLGWRGAVRGLPELAARGSIVPKFVLWPALVIGFALVAGLGLFVLLPILSDLVGQGLGMLPLLGILGEPVIGFTSEHYRAVWIKQAFYRNFLNSMLVTIGVQHDELCRAPRTRRPAIEELRRRCRRRSRYRRDGLRLFHFRRVWCGGCGDRLVEV